MLFPVYTEEQILEMNKPFEPGLCDFAVTEAKEGESEKGNSYVMLTLKIFDKNNTVRFINDFLIATEKMAYKVRHFCYSCGLGDLYESGRNFVPEEFIGRQGVAKIVMRKEKDKDNKLIDRLRVEDYIPENHAPNDTFNDDIPF